MIRTSCKHYEKYDKDIFICHRFDNDRFKGSVEKMTRCCRNCVYYTKKDDGTSKYISYHQHRTEQLMKDKQQTYLDRYFEGDE